MVKDINKLLSEVKIKDIVNLCEYIYLNYLTGDKIENPEDNFKIFLNWDFSSDKTFDISEFKSNKDYKTQYDKASGILTPNIENLIAQKVEAEDFYANIWSTFSNPALFATDDDKIGALIYLENCEKIPYYKLDEPIDIPKNEFEKLYDLVDPDFQKCMFIFNMGYEYRTEVASQILKVIESHSDQKERTVLLARVFHYLEWVFDNSKDDDENEEGGSET